MKQLSDKLDNKQLGLFIIKQMISYNIKYLELLEIIYIYPIFYVLLLELYNIQESKQST